MARKGVLRLFLNVPARIERPQRPQEFDAHATSFRIEPPYDARTFKDESAWLPGETGREEESKVGLYALSKEVPMWSEDQGSSLGDVIGDRFDLPRLVGSRQGHFENTEPSRIFPPFEGRIHSPPLD